MTEMFGEAWPPMSVPDLAPDDDDAMMRGSFNDFFFLLHKRLRVKPYETIMTLVQMYWLSH